VDYSLAAGNHFKNSMVCRRAPFWSRQVELSLVIDCKLEGQEDMPLHSSMHILVQGRIPGHILWGIADRLMEIFTLGGIILM
jgi:hypothetical protein